MSSPLAIASVSMVLKDLLNNGMIDRDVSGMLHGEVKVTALPPDRVDTSLNGEATQLNLFMYMVGFNPGWRNEGLPSTNARAERISNPYLALDLYYLLSAYSAAELYAEILLGFAMQLLFETPVLPREAIRYSLGDVTSLPNVGLPPGNVLPPSLQALSTSGLADQIELIKIIPHPLNTEEIGKLWTAFQTKYRPTAAYKVSVVLIESTKSVSSPLPVKKRKLYVTPMRNPVIEGLASQATAAAPVIAGQKIFPGFRLVLMGSQLNAGNVQLSFNGSTMVTPATADTGSTKITVTLPPTLSAGANTVQVIQTILMGEPPVPHSGVGSNAEVFMLSPVLLNVQVLNLRDLGGGLRAADILLTVGPAIASGQEVVLLLNEVVASPVDDPPPLAYTIAAPPPLSPPVPASPQITIPITGVLTGQYYTRVRVGGAESPFSTDAGGQPNALLLTIP
jgi:hypothetical protein